MQDLLALTALDAFSGLILSHAQSGSVQVGKLGLGFVTQSGKAGLGVGRFGKYGSGGGEGGHIPFMQTRTPGASPEGSLTETGLFPT
jgi:hypothetical protein